jgi:hypothetical protein
LGNEKEMNEFKLLMLITLSMFIMVYAFDFPFSLRSSILGFITILLLLVDLEIKEE